MTIFQKITKRDQSADNGSEIYIGHNLYMIVGNMFDGVKFGAVISKAIKDRESFIIKKHSLEIKTDQRIASAFKTLQSCLVN